MQEVWRELIEALEETLALYRHMLELSETKKNVLVRGKPTELEAINREEESLLIQGKELEHRRAKATAVLVTAWDLANDKPSLDELAAVALPDDAARAGSDLLLSFGRATWPHLMARAMLAEQLWRATSIVAGHPYHREGRQ